MVKNYYSPSVIVDKGIEMVMEIDFDGEKVKVTKNILFNALAVIYTYRYNMAMLEATKLIKSLEPFLEYLVKEDKEEVEQAIKKRYTLKELKKNWEEWINESINGTSRH